MWNRDDFATLTQGVPFTVSVDWNARPSAPKYGHVNSLLALISALHAQGATFSDATGDTISSLRITPGKRKLTDRQKRQFSIVGHHTGSPILTARLRKLWIEVYFNQHLFVETRTSYRQYFPSASVILRPRNFLQDCWVPSPGSWGSDMISMTYDWPGTLVLEAAVSNFAVSIRRNFRGFKFAPAKYKHFLAPSRPPLSERTFLENNGFSNVILGENLDMCWHSLLREIANYVRIQGGRVHGGGEDS